MEKKDANAQKVIVLSLDRKPMMHVINCNTAREMWTKLSNVYQRDNEQQKYVLMQDFFNYTMSKTEDVSTHVGRLQNLVYRIRALGTEITDQMLMSKILVTLPASYKPFVTAWESTSEEGKTTENLISRLLLEEMRNQEQEEKGSIVAFKSTERKCNKCNEIGHLARTCRKERKDSSNKGKRCFSCNKAGHFAKDCPKAGGSKEKNLFCKICKKNNHEEKDCYFRDRETKQRKSSMEKVSFMTQSTNREKWIVDSGTTSHMVNNEKCLNNTERINSKIGVAKTNETMTARKIGSMSFEECTLKDVMYVPDLRVNLLSVNAITENEGEVIFTKEKVIIKRKNEEILQGRKQENGLYEIDLHPDEMNRSLMIEKIGSTEKWHKKLGHLSLTEMKKLLDISSGVEVTATDLKKTEKLCETCMKAKQSRLPFNGQKIRTKRPLELIHTDLCGPVDPPTWDRKRYILTLIDDYTHFTMVYLLKNKHETAETVKEYVQQVEAKWNYKVSRMKSDNGREYVNNNLINWAKAKGIEMNYTVPYSPQMNGTAERLNRTLMEKARALLSDSKMQKEMWGEAILTATYLLNRSPTKILTKTPYEMWKGTKPDLKNLQLFGCTAYAKVLGPLKKLDDRSKKFKFIGYAPQGYRLWDSKRQKITVSRDVRFENRIEDEKETSKNRLKHVEEETEELDGRDEQEEETPENSENDQESEEENGSMNQGTDIEETTDNEDTEEQREDEQETNEAESQIRRSGRERKTPKRYGDYFMLMTYQEATTGPEKEQWKRAIQQEKDSLKKNNTWKIVDRTEAENRKILSSKWVFKRKDNGQKHKARLVIRGCEQNYGIDFEEVFSPVVNSCSLRILFAIAAKRNYQMITFDIKTAFLYGKLEEDIYMQPPQGYNYGDKICKLRKALYGLRQAPIKWNETFTNTLRQRGLESLENEQCIFKNKSGTLILGIYVDDAILLGRDKEEIDALLKDLSNLYEMTVDKEPKSFLGIEIKRTPGKLKLTQKTYSRNLLSKFNMDKSKPVSTPLNKIEEEAEATKRMSFPYREAIGSLLYLTTKTRPDLAQAVGFTSRYVNNPINQRVTDVKRILRYLNGTQDLGLSYSNTHGEAEIQAYCDADYAGDPQTRKSTTGYVIFYLGGPISWGSRKQPIVATSSTEAEYIAAADCCKEILHIKSLIEELLGKSVFALLNIDNQSAIKLIKDGVVNRRSKHIDVKYRFIHEKVKQKIIKIEYCPTDKQLADLFTKPLNKNKFSLCRNALVD